jgi:flagellar basal body-associated protein FliL
VVLQVVFSVVAVVLGFWTISSFNAAEAERPKRYTVPVPKTPAVFEVVAETSIKVCRILRA